MYSHKFVVCCDATIRYCEQWIIPLPVCLERVESRSPLVLRGQGKGKGLGHICECCAHVRRRRTHDDDIGSDYIESEPPDPDEDHQQRFNRLCSGDLHNGKGFKNSDGTWNKGKQKGKPAKDARANSPAPGDTVPIVSENTIPVGHSQEDKSPDHNDLGGKDLFVSISEYTVEEFPKSKSENPANDNHSAERRDGDAEPILAKRLEVDYVGVSSEHHSESVTLDHSSLMELEEPDLYNKSEYSNEDVTTTGKTLSFGSLGHRLTLISVCRCCLYWVPAKSWHRSLEGPSCVIETH